MYTAFKWWAEASDGFSYAMTWLWMAVYFPLDLAVIALSLARCLKFVQHYAAEVFILQETEQTFCIYLIISLHHFPFFVYSGYIAINQERD